MKASFKFILAALAATAALAGCVQEITPPSFENDKVNPAAEGSRVIAVSFAVQPQTKTTLEGFQPKFQDKDSILISNGKALDTCSVSVDGDNATISTDLTGPLKAVYPYKAAKLDGKNPNQIDTVFVSPVQSGTFADANICMAVMKDEKDESLSFENKTAVLRFYVGSEIEVTSVTLESLSECFAPGIQKITVEASGGKTLYDQMPENQDRRVCYVAVPYGMHEQLTITTAAKNQTPEPKKLMKCSLAAGSMYTVFIPYYIEVDGQKWAYCNIGAFLPEEPGEYFMWGEVKGHKADTINKEKTVDENGNEHIVGAFTNDFLSFAEIAEKDARYSINWNSSACFSYCNAPYAASDSDYSRYTDPDYGTLLSEDDAASVNWGGNWRMPTKEEYMSLLSAEKTYFSSGNPGLSFKGNGDNQVFFPATSAGLGADLISLIQINVGLYWSSTLYSSGDKKAITLQFLNEEAAVFENDREQGFPIRPIYGPAPTPGKKEIVLWEGVEVADDWADQPFLLSDAGLELKDANATVGQEVRFYITAIDDNWKLQIIEGHWGPVYCSYCSVGNDTEKGSYTEYDLDANGGYISITLTQAMLDAAFNQGYWGGTFVANGDNVKITKITLY